MKLLDNNSDPISKIINFVRWDGPIDARIRFLTIEDGGGFKEHEKCEKTEFLDYFNSNWHWLPKDSSELNGSLGKPGIFIPKIMVGLKEGALSSWKHYRKNHLYMRNESNTKFYPISRKDTSEWDSRFTEYIGKTKQDYEELCLKLRPRVIVKHPGYNFDTSYIYIILGAEREWLKCLKLIFGEKEIEIDLDSTETFIDSKKRPKFRFYFDNNKRLLFSYYPIFRYGNEDTEILEFCSELRRRQPDI
jgi:hypothetical protein